MHNLFIRFFTQNPIDTSSEIVDSETLNLFRSALLYTIFLTAAFFSFLVAILSVFDIFPLDTFYRNILFAYCMLNIFTYLLLKKDQKYYFVAMNISILSSVLTFTFMTYTVLHDEFRLVWFFLTSFASFILGGRRYGVIITGIIIVLVLTLHIRMDLQLSNYAIFTFISALLTFNIFAHFFLNKIEKDSNSLQERVVQEMDKQQAQEQILLQQYRMTNMGEMIDAIAHQWRQPLAQSNMILFSMDDNLDEETYTKEDTREKITDLLALTSHMSQTIDDFRNLLREDKHTANTFYADKALQEVLTLLKNNLKGIHVEQNIIQDISLVGYKNELIQVLIIVISNAIEALHEYGDDTDKNIYISLEEKDKGISISIEDNAGGIDTNVITKIFDPYFTTKEKSSGSGLGLYIAKIIVEQNMLGSLSVYNISKGAKFNIEIKKSL